MDAYQQAIEGNKKLFEGKIVLDVGCGTGILSLLACRAGAKHVFAVDASTWAAKMAKLVAKENGYLHDDNSGIMTVICGKLEESTALLEPVDIIISEWMGYCLLFESMLDTVLYARDHWLSPRGAILPDKTKLMMAGASEGALDLHFWKNVQGFSMTSIANDILKEHKNRAMIHQVSPEHLLTNTIIVKEFDISTMSPDDINFQSSFLLERQSSKLNDELCHGVVLWFSVEFSHQSYEPKPVILDTSPYHAPTHWAQTIIPFHHSLSGNVKGEICISKSEASRGIDISLRYQSISEDCDIIETVLSQLSIKT